MVAAAAVSVGGAIGGAVLQSNAASRASKKQAAAAKQAAESSLQAGRESNALNWAMYQQQLANQQPYQRGGQLAYSSLMGAMGLGPATTGFGSAPGQASAGQATTQGSLDGVATPGGGEAAQGGAGNAPYSTHVEGVGDVGVTNQGATNAELAQAANTYANKLTGTFAPSDLTTDPSYKWRLEQGQRALEASAAARGMTGSGQNLADIVNYGQGAASQEYQAAFDRYNTNQTNLFNRLASLAGTGQQAANTASAAAGQAGAQMGNTLVGAQGRANEYITQGANSQAAATMAGANAWSGALNNAGGLAGAWMLGGGGGGNPGFSGTQSAAPISNRSIPFVP